MTFYKMRAVSLGLQPFSQLTSPMEIIRQFTPNWFAATMGTGILAIALAQLPDAFSSLGKALWLFNIALFTLHDGSYSSTKRSGFSVTRSSRCFLAVSRWGWPRSSTDF